MVAAVRGQCAGVQRMDCTVRAMTCRFGACCSSALNCPWWHSAEEIKIFKDEVELQKRKLAVRCGFCARGESLVTHVLSVSLPFVTVLPRLECCALSRPGISLSQTLLCLPPSSLAMLSLLSIGTSVGPDCATFPSARFSAAPALSTSFPFFLHVVAVQEGRGGQNDNF